MSDHGVTATEILDEMDRQDEQWGEDRDHPIWSSDDPTARRGYGLPDADTARYMLEDAFRNGEGCWADILYEEVVEVFEATDDSELREELIQVAAVCAQMVEAIDRK
jgi:hypothetical protein